MQHLPAKAREPGGPNDSNTDNEDDNDMDRHGDTRGDAAVETMDVKVALTTDRRVDASNINVDSDHVTRTVTLKGRVPNADQKVLAGQIAVAKAVGYQVRNELTVGC